MCVIFIYFLQPWDGWCIHKGNAFAQVPRGPGCPSVRPSVRVMWLLVGRIRRVRSVLQVGRFGRRFAFPYRGARVAVIAVQLFNDS